MRGTTAAIWIEPDRCRKCGEPPYVFRRRRRLMTPTTSNDMASGIRGDFDPVEGSVVEGSAVETTEIG